MRDRDPLTAFLQWRNPVEIGIDRTHEALHRRAFDTTHESRFVWKKMTKAYPVRFIECDGRISGYKFPFFSIGRVQKGTQFAYGAYGKVSPEINTI